ncbi:ADAMTS-like protein 3 isoform X1, partial [Lates japonicus]
MALCAAQSQETLYWRRKGIPDATSPYEHIGSAGPLPLEGWGSATCRETLTWDKIQMKMESFILCRAVLIFLMLPSVQ